MARREIQRTPESRERVRAMIDDCVANIAAKSLDPNPESEQGRKSIFDRTNERFDRERGYSVGDPDGDKAIA